MIYKLAKTSPYLGGQVKIDIILEDSPGGQLHTSGLCVTPLSEAIPYSADWQTNCLDRSHLDNLRLLYKGTQGYFFNDMAPTDIKGWKNLKEFDNKAIDIANDRYYSELMMGAHRMRYSQYGKQFSFLLPLWTTEPKLDLSFKVCVRGNLDDANRIERGFTLSDDILSYLDKYLEGVDEEVININFDRDSLYVKGVDVESGSKQTKDVSYAYPNLFIRERPVMETDTLFVNLLRNSRIVAQQLLNINFVFNLEDIVPASMADELYGRQWNVYIEAYNGGEKIETRDLYTNYDEIPGYVIHADAVVNAGGEFDASKNVLDYLNDNKALPLIYENKWSQPLFHWCLTDNPNDTYNFYNGYSPYLENESPDSDIDLDEELEDVGLETRVMQIEGRYFDQPDMTQKKYDVSANNCNWCKIIDMSSSVFPEFDYNLTIAGNPDKYTEIPTSGGVVWMHSNKFNISGLNEWTYQDDQHIYVNILLSPNQWDINSFVSQDPENITHVVPIPGSSSYQASAYLVWRQGIYVDGALSDPSWYVSFCITHGAEDLVTAASVIVNEDLPGIITDTDNDVLLYIQDFLKCWETPFVIEYTSTVIPTRADSPKLESQEIDWVKQDGNMFSYLYRYGGSLMPQFIQPDDPNRPNPIWRRKYWRDGMVWQPEVQEYNRMLNTGYDPIYPSIGYFSLEKADEVFSNGFIDNSAVLSYDLCWFDDSFVNCWPAVVGLDYRSENGPIDKYKQDELAARMVKHYLNHEQGPIDTTGSITKEEVGYYSSIADYYFSTDIKFDYANSANLNKIDYHIEYKLK